MRYHSPQAPEGSLRQGSTMIRIPFGEVIWNAELEKKATPTLPLSGWMPPVFCTLMMRLWFLPDFQVSRPVVFAPTAPMPMPATTTAATPPNTSFLRIMALP